MTDRVYDREAGFLRVFDVDEKGRRVAVGVDDPRAELRSKDNRGYVQAILARAAERALRRDDLTAAAHLEMLEDLVASGGDLELEVVEVERDPETRHIARTIRARISSGGTR